jgi:hypothetical protein
MFKRGQNAHVCEVAGQPGVNFGPEQNWLWPKFGLLNLCYCPASFPLPDGIPGELSLSHSTHFSPASSRMFLSTPSGDVRSHLSRAPRARTCHIRRSVLILVAPDPQLALPVVAPALDPAPGHDRAHVGRPRGDGGETCEGIVCGWWLTRGMGVGADAGALA